MRCVCVFVLHEHKRSEEIRARRRGQTDIVFSATGPVPACMRGKKCEVRSGNYSRSSERALKSGF